MTSESSSFTNTLSYPKLAKKTISDFVSNGFMVAESLISPEEVAELRADTARIARGEYPCRSLEHLPETYSDEEALREILCIHQPHYISPIIQSYVEHPKICSILSQITAAHLRYWDGSVKCMQSMLFVKPPNFQGQAWHQDEIYIPTRDRSLIGAWIALDDATVESGCLWVIPGSNQNGYLYPQQEHSETDEYDFGSQSFGFDESLAIPVIAQPGDVVFFNGYLLHKSHKNRSSNYRRVLVNHYMNSWSLLPWSLEEGEHIATADRRAVISVAGTDPYAWKGYDSPKDQVWLRTCKANTKSAEQN